MSTLKKTILENSRDKTLYSERNQMTCLMIGILAELQDVNGRLLFFLEITNETIIHKPKMQTNIESKNNAVIRLVALLRATLLIIIPDKTLANVTNPDKRTTCTGGTGIII